MKNILFSLTLALATCTQSVELYAADEVVLSDQLKPMEATLGAWKIKMTNPEGQTLSGKATFVPELAGTVVTFKTELVDSSGQPVFSRISIFYWQPETKTIAEVNFDSHGWHGSSILVKSTADKMVWQGNGFSGEAKAGASVTEMTRVDANTWTALFRNQLYAGQPLPDSGKITLTRVQ